MKYANGQVVEIAAKYERTATILAKDFITSHGALTKGVTPQNTAGNQVCGTSYIRMDLKSNGYPVHMDTGFTVFPAAVEYTWSAQESGAAGSGYFYTYQAGGTLDDDYSWHGQHTSSKNYPNDYYAGSVVSPSYSILSNLQLCESGYPYDSAYLAH